MCPDAEAYEEPSPNSTTATRQAMYSTPQQQRIGRSVLQSKYGEAVIPSAGIKGVLGRRYCSAWQKNAKHIFTQRSVFNLPKKAQSLALIDL